MGGQSIRETSDSKINTLRQNLHPMLAPPCADLHESTATFYPFDFQYTVYSIQYTIYITHLLEEAYSHRSSQYIFPRWSSLRPDPKEREAGSVRRSVPALNQACSKLNITKENKEQDNKGKDMKGRTRT
jgi:hypothetical protein